MSETMILRGPRSPKMYTARRSCEVISTMSLVCTCPVWGNRTRTRVQSYAFVSDLKQRLGSSGSTCSCTSVYWQPCPQPVHQPSLQQHTVSFPSKRPSHTQAPAKKKNLPRIPQAIWSRSEAVWDTKTSSVTHARCVDMGAVSARGVPGTLGSEVQDPVLQLAPWKAETSTGTHKACPLNRNPEAPKNERRPRFMSQTPLIMASVGTFREEDVGC